MQNPDRIVKVCVLISAWSVSVHQINNVLGVMFANQVGFEPVFQKGMSYRHYPYPYDSAQSNESLQRLAEINTEYVAIIVWWLQENISSTQIYPETR